MKKNYLDFNRSQKNNTPYMRDVFIDQITSHAKSNKDIYFTTPDMGAPSLDIFRKDLPKQFLHSGICEQHMISMAAGLTLMKKKIICYAMAPFITSRCYEQIKCSVSAMNQPVNLVGIGIGLGYADAGPTHYSTEDIAIMRVFPNIEILTPCDQISTKIMADYTIQKNSFKFIRLDIDILPDIYSSESELDINKGYSEILKGNGKKCIVTSGYLLHKCKKIIEEKYKDLTLVDLFKIKPLNDNLIEYLEKFDEIVTFEEQWIEGGFGSAILEAFSKKNILKKIKRYGLQERFFFENGGREYLFKNYGLNLEKIFKDLY